MLTTKIIFGEKLSSEYSGVYLYLAFLLDFAILKGNPGEVPQVFFEQVT
jgi:hypothetical protein